MSLDEGVCKGRFLKFGCTFLNTGASLSSSSSESVSLALFPMEVDFNLLPLSVVAWLTLLIMMKIAKKCFKFHYRLLFFFVAGVCILSIWPLPLAVAMGYTISVVSMMRENDLGYYYVFFFGNMIVLFFVVLSLPNPVVEDGTHNKPVILYDGVSFRLVLSLCVFLVLGSFPARIHYDYRWMSSMLNYVGYVCFLSGWRRFVGGIWMKEPAIIVSGALYLFSSLFSLTKIVRHPLDDGDDRRELVEGPGVYIAIPVSVLMMVVDDQVDLETHQRSYSCIALVLVALLQIRPTIRFVRLSFDLSQDLRHLYEHINPNL